MASPTQPPHMNWWEKDISVSILETIYWDIWSLGLEPTLGSPDSIDRLLTNSDIDKAVKQAYGKLHPQFPENERSTLPIDWRDDKRKILDRLFSMHRDRPTVQSPSISHVSTAGKDAGPWGRPIELPIPPSYQTPETPGTLPRHPPSLPGTPSTNSDHAIKPRDPAIRSPPGRLVTTSPGDSASPEDSRRRKSSASTQGERPGKRARGPQQHICPECKHVYPYPSKLQDHMKSHDDKKPLPCRQKGCNKVFKRQREVKAHLKSVHRVPISPPSSAPPVLPPQSPVPPSLSLPIAPTPPSAVSSEDPATTKYMPPTPKHGNCSESLPAPPPHHASRARSPMDGHESVDASERNPNINRSTIEMEGVSADRGGPNTGTMTSPQDCRSEQRPPPDPASPAESDSTFAIVPKSEPSSVRELSPDSHGEMSNGETSNGEISSYNLSALGLVHRVNE